MLLSLSKEFLLMPPVLLVSQRLLLAESLLQLFLLHIGALATRNVLQLLGIVYLELVVSLLTLQCHFRLMQTAQNVEVFALASLLDLLVDVAALATPADLVQYLSR